MPSSTLRVVLASEVAGSAVVGRTRSVPNGISAQINGFFPGAITPLGTAEVLQFAGQVQPVTTISTTATGGVTTPAVTVTVSVGTFPPFSSATQQGTFPAPTGSVLFVDESNPGLPLGIAQLNAQGVATFTTTSLSPGIHRIRAVYSGDGVYPATSPSPVLVVSGTPNQARLFTLLMPYEGAANRAATAPRFARLLRQLERGTPARRVARAILQALGLPSLTAARRPAAG